MMESDGIGRTEQFTPVRVEASSEAGTVIDVTIAGHDGRRLLAA
jgi:threonylcarbamoyladenosine tRNA methylthiotransferase MtaB